MLIGRMACGKAECAGKLPDCIQLVRPFPDVFPFVSLSSPLPLCCATSLPEQKMLIGWMAGGRLSARVSYQIAPEQKMLIGRMADGRLSARVSYQVTDSLALKVNAQIVNEPHFSQGMFQLDYKGEREGRESTWEAGECAQIVNEPHFSQGMFQLDYKVRACKRERGHGKQVSYQVTDSVALKVNAQIVNEPHFSQGMFQLDYKGSDYQWQAQAGNNAFYGGSDYQWQAQAGNNAFYGVNYIQSVTPTLSLGGEAFWLGHQRRSGLGIAGRYNTDKVVATAQVASTGVVSMTYVQRVSDKVALAADFLHNWNSKESATSVGYDYILRQCRPDTNGLSAAGANGHQWVVGCGGDWTPMGVTPSVVLTIVFSIFFSSDPPSPLPHPPLCFHQPVSAAGATGHQWVCSSLSGREA
ncbi:unnamed protein product [Closterium sp. Naga37s-1]|nr:unnamed protein product [Closterium sp. Naga37s-1]